MRERRIAILMHEEANEDSVEDYYLSGLVNHWQRNGHEIIFLFGTERFVPADLLFVHVDLSVVPQAYRAFADRYPIAINDNVKEDQGVALRPDLLQPDDDWDGPVIVKSDKYAVGPPGCARGGLFVKAYKKLLATMFRLGLDQYNPPLGTAVEYPIYDHLQEVPPSYFYNFKVSIQKFTPEKEDGFYCVRQMRFLGDHLSCTRLKGKHPVVRSKNAEVVEQDINPHPKIVALRDRLQFDYGKFDYVVTGGEATLLSAHKTIPRTPAILEDARMRAHPRYIAEGLQSFFENMSSTEEPPPTEKATPVEEMRSTGTFS